MVTRRTVLAGSASALVGVLTGCSAAKGSTPAPAGTPAGFPSLRASPRASSAGPSPSPTATLTQPAPTGTPQPKVSRTVAADLDIPWGLAFLRSGDALVTERNSAKLLRVSATGKVVTLGEVAGVAPPVGSGEGGLLGIALAPGDEDTVFAYLTSRSDNRVVRFSIAGGKVGRPRSVLTGIPTSTHHHGGRLLFDAEGMLLVATGDAEQPALAQHRSSLAGKILRIRPDGRAAGGNPYGNRTWSYGHRNIEGLAFDAAGRLWATEFGDQRADELNQISRGKNYGWPRVEGRSDNSAYVSPQATWSPTSSCSPAGLAINRSTAFVGALQGRCLFSVALNGTSAAKPKAHFANDYGRIRNVVAAPDGALWMTTSNTDGRVEPGKSDDRILRVSL